MQKTALYVQAVSERDFCNWVGSRSGHIHTLTEPYQSSFGSGPRPPLQLSLGPVVWSAPECDCCIHTCPNDPHKRETNLSSIQSNQTRQVWIHPKNTSIFIKPWLMICLMIFNLIRSNKSKSKSYKSYKEQQVRVQDLRANRVKNSK